MCTALKLEMGPPSAFFASNFLYDFQPLGCHHMQSKLNLQKFQSFIKARNVFFHPLPQQSAFTFVGGAKLPLQLGGGSFCPWLFEEDLLFESIQLLGLSNETSAVWYAREGVERFVDKVKVVISLSHHCDDNKKVDWLFAFEILWIYTPWSNSGKLKAYRDSPLKTGKNSGGDSNPGFLGGETQCILHKAI